MFDICRMSKSIPCNKISSFNFHGTTSNAELKSVSNMTVVIPPSCTSVVKLWMSASWSRASNYIIKRWRIESRLSRHGHVVLQLFYTNTHIKYFMTTPTICWGVDSLLPTTKPALRFNFIIKIKHNLYNGVIKKTRILLLYLLLQRLREYHNLDYPKIAP